MHAELVLVDGYSLLHRWKPGPFASAEILRGVRENLIAKMSEWQSWVGVGLTLVFDGQEGGRDEGMSRRSYQVVYTRGESADTWIERLVLHETKPFRLMVVSSDLAVLHTVAARGGQAITCEEFLRRVQPLGGAVRTARRGRLVPRPYAPSLGDFFPK